MRPHFATVGEIKKTNVLSAKTETSAYQVALSLLDSSFQGMPIVDAENRVVGKITENDLLKALLEGKDLEKMEAGEIMQRCPVVIETDTPMEEAVRYMIELHLLRIPVVDQRGRLIASVTRHDLLRGWLGVWVNDERRGYVNLRFV